VVEPVETIETTQTTVESSELALATVTMMWVAAACYRCGRKPWFPSQWQFPLGCFNSCFHIIPKSQRDDISVEI